MQVDAAVFAGTLAARQYALIYQPDHKVDRTIFGQQRGVEGDFIDAIYDLNLRSRGCAPFDRIDLDQQHILGLSRAEERKDRRITYITAVPVGARRRFRPRGRTSADRRRP